MARYIDVEKVHTPKGFFKDLNVPKLLYWLKSQPTADVVEVVRCKDCVAREKATLEPFVCSRNKMLVYNNSYCSYGKRKCEDTGRKYAEGFADGWQGTKEKVRAYNDFLQKKMNIKSD